MGDVNVVHGDPQQAGRDLPHELANDIDGKLVGTRKRQCMSAKGVHRKLEHTPQLFQLKFVAGDLRSVEGRFVVVAQEVFVVNAALGRRGEQVLGKNDLSALAQAVGAMAAFADAVEAVAGGDNPGVRSGALKIAAEIFKDGGVFRRQGSEIVDGLVGTSRQAGRGDVVAQ